MVMRFFVFLFFCLVAPKAFGDGCTSGNCPAYKRGTGHDTGTSGGNRGNRATQSAPPVYAPPSGPLTPSQCKQKDPIQWGLRFTYFRTVWAVVAVKCSSIQGSGVDKDQYRQFTITHNRDYVEIENFLGRASNSTNYSQAGRADRLKAQQERNNANARALGTSALQAEELPWS